MSVSDGPVLNGLCWKQPLVGQSCAACSDGEKSAYLQVAKEIWVCDHKKVEVWSGKLVIFTRCPC